jgi:gamma-glutamylcyclotransferase (GGCT)/AIG2-like uncharacterized protein YtfP
MGARRSRTMTVRPVHLFVYGTLRRDRHHAMHHVLTRDATLLGLASVPGRLHDLGAYPGAVPSAEGRRVRGELYALRNPDTTLAVLDAYEGYAPDAGAPQLFERGLVEATLEAGDAVAAWIYWYAGAIPSGSLIASGAWQGATGNG